MKITAITAQQKNKERYNIFVDENYLFSVDEAVLVKFQLKKNKSLTNEEIDEIVEADEIRKGLNRAIQFLARRVRSEKEVRDYLKKQEISEAHISTVIQKLADMNYLDDAEFAKLYIKTQMKTTTKGKGKIERELVEKGITRELITDTVPLYSEDLQLENATKEARKIARRGKKTSRKILTQKIVTDLLQKGYSIELSKKAAEVATIDLNEDSDEQILGEQLEKLIRKNKRLDPKKAKQKTIQSLMQKGFQYDTIQSYLVEHEIVFEEVEQD
jgi:regulatory protein